MKSFLAFPPARELRGSLRVPSSKSATNRALLLAALSDTPVRIERPLDSEDTRALLSCLTAMGAQVARDGDALVLSGPLRGGDVSATVLDARESGTAARFLIAVAAGTPGRFRVVGSARLSERPMGELTAALRALGADIVEEGAAGCLPLAIGGTTLGGGPVAVDASRSSQFVSALLLAGAAGRSIEVSAAAGAVASLPYVAMTVESLRAFGHRVEGHGPWRVERGEGAPKRYETPGDYSSAVPILAGAGICGGEVRLTGLRWPSADADALALPILASMGIEISTAADGIVSRAERGKLRPVSVSMSGCPDAVPPVAAAAAFAAGRSRLEDVAHLRWKESDRLEALSSLLQAAGAAGRFDAGGLIVDGGGIDPGSRLAVLPTAGDHRIAMAAGLMSLVRGRAVIENPDCVSKSYPGFFRDLDALSRR